MESEQIETNGPTEETDAERRRRERREKRQREAEGIPEPEPEPQPEPEPVVANDEVSLEGPIPLSFAQKHKLLLKN